MSNVGIVILEGVVVGAVLALISWIFSLLKPYKRIGMYPTIFTIGFLTHIFFELTGLNAYYVFYKTKR